MDELMYTAFRYFSGEKATNEQYPLHDKACSCNHIVHGLDKVHLAGVKFGKKLCKA
jgi:hypothetical protein